MIPSRRRRINIANLVQSCSKTQAPHERSPDCQDLSSQLELLGSLGAGSFGSDRYPGTLLDYLLDRVIIVFL